MEGKKLQEIIVRWLPQQENSKEWVPYKWEQVFQTPWRGSNNSISDWQSHEIPQEVQLGPKNLWYIPSSAQTTYTGCHIGNWAVFIELVRNFFMNLKPHIQVAPKPSCNSLIQLSNCLPFLRPYQLAWLILMFTFPKILQCIRLYLLIPARYASL